LNLTSQNIKNQISAKAKELGFTACGFAKYEVLEDESARLSEWLTAGMQADMAWIGKGFEKRKDLRLIMPEARSVISLAFSYYTPFEHDESKPKISRYAWGKDYHKLLKPKLKELCEFIGTTSPNPLLRKEGALDTEHIHDTNNIPQDEQHVICRTYVDDGPVMDKAWAVKAGIGWMGKHTNVINPDFGSWFFISEILTNLEFETYDTPIEDMCGECSLCISACPTGAIVSEYVVDSNKCISYQTIENRGEIPPEIDLDGWIFGCDVCQDVCPYNSPKYNHETEEKAFWPKNLTSPPSPLLKGEGGNLPEVTKHPIINLNIEELSSFTEEQFVELFADSPVKRTKFKGWKRNLNRLRSAD